MRRDTVECAHLKRSIGASIDSGYFGGLADEVRRVLRTVDKKTTAKKFRNSR